MEILNNNVKELMQTFINKGYEIFIVGGCVRDFVLGVDYKDIDFATNAIPDEIESLFPNTIPTGKDYGTISVQMYDETFEVTTYRLESEYIDSRRPSVVKYAKTLEEDLSRRDLTINSMAMDIDGNIIDLFGGTEDLENGIIKFVGNPENRLNDDTLRALRCIRFASRFDFHIEYESDRALNYVDISNLSAERVREEFNKIIVCRDPRYWLGRMLNCGLLQQFIPELKDINKTTQNNPNHNTRNVFEHSIKAMDKIEPKLELRLAMLFHDLGKSTTKTTGDDGIDHFYVHHVDSAKMARKIMRRMKYPNDIIDYVCDLVYHHMIRYFNSDITPKTARRFLNKVGVDMYEDLIKVMVADRLGAVTRYEGLGKIYRLQFECEKVIENKQPFSISDLKINGHDLIGLGYKGKEIGDKLKELLNIILENDTMNKRETLLEISR